MASVSSPGWIPALHKAAQAVHERYPTTCQNLYTSTTYFALAKSRNDSAFNMASTEADRRQQLVRLIGKPMPPPRDLPDVLIKDELKAFGFSPEQVSELMKKKEPEVDACTQIPGGAAERRKDERAQEAESFINREIRERQRRNREKTSPEGKKMSRGYEPLPIEGTDNWVLLDIHRGFPPTLPGPPPEIFVRLSCYVPGNKKIIAYNTRSHSIGLRKTPKNLEGCTVEYHKSGPKLISALEKKLIKKRASKTTVEPEDPSPPPKQRQAQPEDKLSNFDEAEKPSPPKTRRGKNAQAEVQEADIAANLAENEAVKKPSPPRMRQTKADAQPEIQNDDKPVDHHDQDTQTSSPTSKKRRSTSSSQQEIEINDNDDAEEPSASKKRRGRGAALPGAQQVATTANLAGKKPAPPRKRRMKASDTSKLEETDTFDLTTNDVHGKSPPRERRTGAIDDSNITEAGTIEIIDNSMLKMSSPPKERFSPPDAQDELAPELDGNAKQPLPPKERRSPPDTEAEHPAGGDDTVQTLSPPKEGRSSATLKPDTQNEMEKDEDAGSPSPASDIAPVKKRRSARLSTEKEIKKESDEEAADSAVATPAVE
ncbi:hypothetical protein DOTSEDRAFT_22398 [Dothistroma septosporum NZE10]|uniref:Uncharacterized protein n=1 Tax=Dothistroma septosporum (strain NZE10 / CBS 128990) TaxID=675120 RepID=N1PVC4_DOTSN|nr:hypothetical protein DOTSEDRAFT_22398 [Dothistroma septosporum NZE10]